MRRTRNARTLPIGSISTGTLRMEDLIPALLWELEHIRLTRPHRRVVQAIRKSSEIDGYFESTDWDCTEDYQELCDIAECYVPDYCYFGAIEGDGADVGVWVNWDRLEEDAVAHRRFLARHWVRSSRSS